MPLPLGTRLGAFEIRALLGSGAMGEVYRAHDARLGRDVAIKVLPEDLIRKPQALARLEREAQAIAAISHPNILAIFQFDTDAASGVAFLVTELLEGDTLRARIERSPVGWRKAAEIGAGIADALAAAHAKGIVHRDLKPENIFLTTDDRVKVLDFGLARVSQDISGADDRTRAGHLTDPGTVLGTVNYMSPEQVRGERAGATSDVFSLGSVLFELLAGVPPFRAESGPETMAAIVREPPAAFDFEGRGIPSELLAIVMHCLEKRPDDRFQSARDLAFDLKSLASGSGARTPFQSRSTIDSIAVIPFENPAQDPAMDYLTDGITETIISRLARLPGLRVMARSTVFRYKGKSIEPEVIGQSLHVRSVLTGRVIQRGEMLTISAELMSVADGSQLWSERYHRNKADLLVVEDEIANEVTDKLRVRLSGPEKHQLVRSDTRNSEAYQAYLKGRYHWSKRTESGLKKGIDFFNQALEDDPTYALAWVGLADSHNVAGFYSVLPPADAFPRAEAAARRALEIEPENGEAHASLAYAVWMHRWNSDESGRLFRRSFELNDGYAIGHYWYGWTLVTQGRVEEATPELQRGVDLDPLSLWLNAGVGWSRYLCRDFVGATDQLRKTVALDESFGLARAWLALTYRARGLMREALAEAERSVSQMELKALPLQALASMAAASGDRDAALRTRDELVRLSEGRYLQPYYMAAIDAELDDHEGALLWLERGLAERSHLMVMLGIDPAFDVLRSSPRFQQIVDAVRSSSRTSTRASSQS